MTRMQTQTPPRMARRINLRLWLFVAVALVIVGAPAYIYVREILTQGVQKHGEYYTVDLKAMGNFPFDELSGKLSDVPEVYRKLDGKRVVFEGQMYADDAAGPEVNHFQLVYSIAKCCFGGPPQVQERVFAKVPNGGKVGYYPDLARVTGILHVRTQLDQGRIISLYDMDVEKVEPL